jgi:hypothetical protein
MASPSSHLFLPPLNSDHAKKKVLVDVFTCALFRYHFHDSFQQTCLPADHEIATARKS